MKGRRGNPGLKGHLVEKSVEGYILALETINRLSIKYRVETFCYLICNAWELLLKAKILVDAGNDRNAIREQQGDEHQNADHQLERPLVAAIGQDNDRTEHRTPM